MQQQHGDDAVRCMPCLACAGGAAYVESLARLAITCGDRTLAGDASQVRLRCAAWVDAGEMLPNRV